MQLLINKYLDIDMATVMDSVPVFEGKEQEDIQIWLKEIDLVTKVANLNEHDIVRLIVFKTRGKAREMLGLISKDIPNLPLADLKKHLEMTCVNSNEINKKFKEFISTDETKNYQEFSKLLKALRGVRLSNMLFISAISSYFTNKKIY